MKNKYSKWTEDLYTRGGYHIVNVEKGIQGSKFLKADLLGFLDYLAFTRGVMVGVQSTDSHNRPEHRKKILRSPLALLWLWAGERIHLVSWKSLGHSQNEIARTPRVEIITEMDFAEEIILKAKKLLRENNDNEEGSLKDCQRRRTALRRRVDSSGMASIGRDKKRTKSLSQGSAKRGTGNSIRQIDSNTK